MTNHPHRSTYKTLANALFAELAALKARAPDCGLGTVGLNGVSGEVSVLAFPASRTLTVFLRDGWNMVLTKEQAINLVARLRAGGSMPISPSALNVGVQSA